MGLFEMRERTKKQVKANSWKYFSKYIRLKDADNNGYVKCVTCGSIKFWKEMQSGHYMHNKCDYDDRNVHPQCIKCNKWLSGNGIEYERYMRNTYTENEIDMLRLKANKTGKKDIYYYLDVEKEVKAKYKKLLEERPELKSVL